MCVYVYVHVCIKSIFITDILKKFKLSKQIMQHILHIQCQMLATMDLMGHNMLKLANSSLLNYNFLQSSQAGRIALLMPLPVTEVCRCQSQR